MRLFVRKKVTLAVYSKGWPTCCCKNHSKQSIQATHNVETAINQR